MDDPVDGDVWDDFGQKVDLTARLREILLNYPESTSILKGSSRTRCAPVVDPPLFVLLAGCPVLNDPPPRPSQNPRTMPARGR